MQLTTPRLILRELREDDLDDFFHMFGDAAFRHYEGSPLTLEETRARLEKFIAWRQAQPRKCFSLAITLPSDDRMVGEVHLKSLSPDIDEWEIGWGVNPACWGMGYAPEAARAMLQFAFSELKAHRVMALCHSDNTPSTRVMEKIGMRCEGRLRQVRRLNGAWWDEYVYAILEGDRV